VCVKFNNFTLTPLKLSDFLGGDLLAQAMKGFLPLMWTPDMASITMSFIFCATTVPFRSSLLDSGVLPYEPQEPFKAGKLWGQCTFLCKSRVMKPWYERKKLCVLVTGQFCPQYPGDKTVFPACASKAKALFIFWTSSQWSRNFYEQVLFSQCNTSACTDQENMNSRFLPESLTALF